MKNCYFIIACAAAVLATGCAKEAQNNASNSSRTTIAVSIAEATRTTLGELSSGKRPIYWANGDVLLCNGVESEPLAEVPENSTEVEFTFPEVLSTPYNLLYPASLYKSAETITLPATCGNIPLGGRDGEISAITGAVKLTIKGGEHADKISYVKLTSATAQLSGDFTIDYADGTLAATSTADADKSVKAMVNKALAKDETVELFIPVPAGNYSFTVRIVDVLGHYMDKSTTAAKTIVAGQINAFPELVFAPTGTQFDVEIDSAQKWNEFATAYNADPDQYNSSVIGFTGDLDFTGKELVTAGNYDEGVYFGGTILGEGHSIKNLTASSNALLGGIAGSGIVKDITIDESCSYAVPYTVGVQKHFGPFAEYVKGRMENCHNKASLTLSSNGSDNNKDIYIGGLVGLIREGILVGCTNSGAITFDNTYISSEFVYAGGIVGYMSNAEGIVENCSNSGTLTTDAWSRQVIMGGIAGTVNGQITDCTNGGVLTSSLPRPKGDSCKFITYGGIAGQLNDNCVVKNNVNTANLTTSSGVKQHYMGGIAGQIAGTVKTLENNTSSGNISSTGKARNLYLGGLYGAVKAENTLNLTGSPFTGSISFSGYESYSGDKNSDSWYSFYFVGGIVGYVNKAVEIVGESCSLNCNITTPLETVKVKELFMGGVVGAAGEDGSGNPVDGAKITISGITVGGDIKMTEGKGLKPQFKKSSLGGIIGGAFAGAEISNCSSSANVYFGGASTASSSNGCPSHLGGIAGRIEGADSIIDDCSCSGKVYNYLYNNNWWNTNKQVGINAASGIIGCFGYNIDNTFKIEISNCSSSATCYGYRGTASGIAGYLNKATVSGCSFTGSISRGAPSGGIAGVARECKINGCTVKSKSIEGQCGGSCIGHAGGILGLAEGTSVDDCKSFVTTLSATDTSSVDSFAGGIIGCPDADCTIGKTKVCSFGGKIGSAVSDIVYTAVTAENCATLATGNTLMTEAPNVSYWDGK